MKSYKDQKLLFSLLILGLFAGVSGRIFETTTLNITGTTNPNAASVISANEPVEKVVFPVVEPVITLGFAGDISLSHKVATSIEKNHDGDYATLFADAHFLSEPDVTFAHLNGVVSTLGTKTDKDSFAIHPDAISSLKNAGIDVVSIADAHVVDEGDQAFVDTLTKLHAAGIATCGGGMNKAEAEMPAILARNGTTIGYLCFSDIGTAAYGATDTSSGILLASDPNFSEIIKNAAEKLNTLIVSFNFGVDAGTLPTARQVELAKTAINYGASFVAGTHPHASQMIASYHGVSIAYSIGDFISDYSLPKGDPDGTFITASLSGKVISGVTAHQLTHNKNYVPSLAQ